MNKVKKVCLVYPRLKYPNGDPPLGILSIASYLRANIKDLKLDFIDTTFNPSFTFVKKRLVQLNPDIVGIYMDTMMFNDSLEAASISKELNFHVVIGGPHPTILPKTVIQRNCVDAILIGEGEQGFAEYIEEFYSNKEFTNVKGCWFKEGSKAIQTPRRKPIMDLDKLPPPAFDLLDYDRYIKSWYHFGYLKNIRGTSVIGSRGCPFDCSYCQPTLNKIFGSGVRYRTVQNLIRELRHLQNRYHINAFHMQDDTSTARKDWIIDFSKALIDSGLKFHWSCNSRVDTLDEEVLTCMKKSGLIEVRIGIESMTPRIRQNLFGKNITHRQIMEGIRMIRKYRLYVFAYFMIGAPTETAKEIKKTIDFAAKSPIDVATFSITTPLPTTHLHANLCKTKDDKNFQDFDYYRANKKTYSQLPRWKLDFYKKLAYLKFYLHPRRFNNTIQELFEPSRVLLKLKRL